MTGTGFSRNCEELWNTPVSSRIPDFGSYLRKNSIQTEVSTSTLAKAMVSVAQIFGLSCKFQSTGEGFDTFKFPQSNFIFDCIDDRLGFAAGVNQGHELSKEILWKSYGCSCHGNPP
jgi:hypothetical protein